MNKTFKYLSIAVVGAIAIIGCKPEEKEDPVNTLESHVHHKWGADDFALNTIYNVGGTDITIQELKFYLSDFQLHDDGSGHQDLGDRAIMVVAGVSDHAVISNLNLTHIHEMDFLLGLNESVNHQDPTTAPSPLNSIDMHWSWNSDAGYKFIKIQGERDSDGDGVFESFEIHCATDNLKRNLEADIHQDLANGKVTLNIEVDYEKFFTGVDFSVATLDGTHGDGMLTNQIADNVANGAIKFE